MAALRFKIPRKRFRLLVRTPGGTMSMQDGERLKTTPLGREVWLRWHLLIFDQTIYAVDGIRTWAAYARHLPDIAAATAAIAAVLRAYRERRVELGLFHLRPLRKLLVFRLMSPLLVMPLPDALEKNTSIEALLKTRNQLPHGGVHSPENISAASPPFLVDANCSGARAVGGGGPVRVEAETRESKGGKERGGKRRWSGGGGVFFGLRSLYVHTSVCAI
uniref:Uncharacterized protein n=1 Tax=Oryza barthii TaxID=65489 RepID=A0A0D3G1T2_9ORYZ